MAPQCPYGAAPDWLIQGSVGNFYGLAGEGGTAGQGAFFKIISQRHLSTLYSFCTIPYCTDGGHPSSMLEGTDGNFYGTTSGSSFGVYTYGAFFKITQQDS